MLTENEPTLEYRDLNGRRYRYLNSHKPLTHRGEHNEVAEHGITLWSQLPSGIWAYIESFEDMSGLEEFFRLMHRSIPMNEMDQMLDANEGHLMSIGEVIKAILAYRRRTGADLRRARFVVYATMAIMYPMRWEDPTKMEREFPSPRNWKPENKG